MKLATIAGLDIGTTKTCAVVATVRGDGVQIIGFGEAPSAGLRKGVVTNLDEAIRSIEIATERAERMAGVHISHVYVGITGEHVQCTNHRGVTSVSGPDYEVLEDDVRRVVASSRSIDVGADRQIIHALPRQFSLDGQSGVIDPVGMSGSRLEVDTHIITGSSNFIANVLKCVHRAGLEPAGIVFEALASSASTLCREERRVGVVLLDIGGGTTDIVVYSGGGARFTSTVPIGGNMLSNDISLGLKTSFSEAERLKRTYGCTVGDAQEEIGLTLLDGRTAVRISSANLYAITLPRAMETLRMAREAVFDHIPSDLVLAEVVLTGGGAHLRGLEMLASDVFGLPARIGIPEANGSVGESVRRPEYATALGLVLFGPKGDGVVAPPRRARATPLRSRITRWFGNLWN
ncbi:MAG TPA: cell division protein FtsA [Candidatus Baltobacteraceae bacterium]|nr:cell division protein FtsA [Candidatus Baltobacteraceae bacterium]